MVLDLPVLLLKSQAEERIISKKELFTRGKTNKAFSIVPEGVAITGFISVQAYGLGNQIKDFGFELSYAMKNKSGGTRTVDFTITNNTQGTTLDSGSIDLSDGEITSATFFATLEQVNPGDFVRFTFSNQGVGTAGGSATFAYVVFESKGVFYGES